MYNHLPCTMYSVATACNIKVATPHVYDERGLYGFDELYYCDTTGSVQAGVVHHGSGCVCVYEGARARGCACLCVCVQFIAVLSVSLS